MSGLRGEALGVTLGSGKVLLHPSTVAVPRGTICGLIGPNGAGKTTLLRALAGLIAHGGQVSLDGDSLPPPGSAARARRIGYLPQGHEVHWPLSVRHTVALGRLPHGDTASGPVETALAAAGVAELAERSVSTLSGGERARVMLARVLAGQPQVLLADEPVAALDPAHQLRVMQLLRQQARAEQRAVLVVLHDLSLAARFCDSLILLAEGRILATSTAGMIPPAVLEEAYGVPFVLGTVAQVPLVVPQERPGG